MRDLRAVIHGITTAVLCGVAVFSCSTISKAAGETYQTAVEAAYGDTFRGVYENYLAGSPLEAENPDGVDTASGRLMLSRTDLSLEGTGGMDLELNRYYDSNEANLGHATVEYLDKLEIDTVWVKYLPRTKTQITAITAITFFLLLNFNVVFLPPITFPIFSASSIKTVLLLSSINTVLFSSKTVSPTELKIGRASCRERV